MLSEESDLERKNFEKDNTLQLTNLDTVTNALLLKMDDNFNRLYDKSLNANHSVMNKEELLKQINLEIGNKDNTIVQLQLFVFFAFLIMILCVMNAMGKLKGSALIGAIIALLVLYSIIIYLNLYKITSVNALDIFRALREARREWKQERRKENADEYVGSWTCPAECPPLGTAEEEGGAPVYSDYVTMKGATLRTDSQKNVWERGDVPVDIFTTPQYHKDIYNNPKVLPVFIENEQQAKTNNPGPQFRGLKEKGMTYYECKWMGGKTSGLPFQEKDKYSSIPCDYRPNFKELNRYICTKNPNKNPGAISDYCQNVTKL